jgi:phage tail sheath gpL-like
MKFSLLALVALYCIGTSAAFADGSQATSDRRGPAGIAVGEPLVTAKAKLVKQGWKPTRMHTTDDYEYSGVERELAARKFFEVDVCSFDSSRCILFYSKHGACLRVDTIGEQFNDMTVTRWADECPDAPPKPSKRGAG